MSESKTKKSVHDVAFEDATDVYDIRYRLHALDVGFELKGSGTAAAIEKEPTLRVSYADRDGQRRVMEGPFESVVRRLRRLGYSVRVVRSEEEGVEAREAREAAWLYALQGEVEFGQKTIGDALFAAYTRGREEGEGRS